MHQTLSRTRRNLKNQHNAVEALAAETPEGVEYCSRRSVLLASDTAGAQSVMETPETNNSQHGTKTTASSENRTLLGAVTMDFSDSINRSPLSVKSKLENLSRSRSTKRSLKTPPSRKKFHIEKADFDISTDNDSTPDLNPKIDVFSSDSELSESEFAINKRNLMSIVGDSDLEPESKSPFNWKKENKMRRKSIAEVILPSDVNDSVALSRKLKLNANVEKLAPGRRSKPIVGSEGNDASGFESSTKSILSKKPFPTTRKSIAVTGRNHSVAIADKKSNDMHTEKKAKVYSDSVTPNNKDIAKCQRKSMRLSARNLSSCFTRANSLENDSDSLDINYIEGESSSKECFQSKLTVDNNLNQKVSGGCVTSDALAGVKLNVKQSLQLDDSEGSDFASDKNEEAKELKRSISITTKQHEDLTRSDTLPTEKHLTSQSLEMPQTSIIPNPSSSSAGTEASKPSKPCLKTPAAAVDAKLPATREILKGVTVFVDVRSSDGSNRSAAMRERLAALGADVRLKLTQDVTHVVFRDGLKSTYQVSTRRGLYLVSCTWVECCRQTGTRVPEVQYPSTSLHKYQDPLFLARLRKTRSMQPKDFSEDLAAAEERIRRRLRRQARASPAPSPAALQEESPLQSICHLLTPKRLPSPGVSSGANGGHSPKNYLLDAVFALNPSLFKDKVDKNYFKLNNFGFESEFEDRNVEPRQAEKTDGLVRQRNDSDDLREMLKRKYLTNVQESLLSSSSLSPSDKSITGKDKSITGSDSDVVGSSLRKSKRLSSGLINRRDYLNFSRHGRSDDRNGQACENGQNSVGNVNGKFAAGSSEIYAENEDIFMSPHKNSEPQRISEIFSKNRQKPVEVASKYGEQSQVNSEEIERKKLGEMNDRVNEASSDSDHGNKDRENGHSDAKMGKYLSSPRISPRGKGIPRIEIEDENGELIYPKSGQKIPHEVEGVNDHMEVYGTPSSHMGSTYGTPQGRSPHMRLRARSGSGESFLSGDEDFDTPLAVRLYTRLAAKRTQGSLGCSPALGRSIKGNNIPVAGRRSSSDIESPPEPKTLAPTAGVDKATAPTGGVDKATAPTGGVYKVLAPTAGVDKATAPTAGVDKVSAPTGGVDKVSASTGGVDKATAPTAGVDKATAPTGGVDAGLESVGNGDVGFCGPTTGDSNPSIAGSNPTVRGSASPVWGSKPYVERAKSTDRGSNPAIMGSEHPSGGSNPGKHSTEPTHTFTKNETRRKVAQKFDNFSAEDDAINRGKRNSVRFKDTNHVTKRKRNYHRSDEKEDILQGKNNDVLPRSGRVVNNKDYRNQALESTALTGCGDAVVDDIGGEISSISGVGDENGENVGGVDGSVCGSSPGVKKNNFFKFPRRSQRLSSALSLESGDSDVFYDVSIVDVHANNVENIDEHGNNVENSDVDNSTNVLDNISIVDIQARDVEHVDISEVPGKMLMLVDNASKNVPDFPASADLKATESEGKNFVGSRKKRRVLMTENSDVEPDLIIPMTPPHRGGLTSPRRGPTLYDELLSQKLNPRVPSQRSAIKAMGIKGDEPLPLPCSTSKKFIRGPLFKTQKKNISTLAAVNECGSSKISTLGGQILNFNGKSLPEENNSEHETLDETWDSSILAFETPNRRYRNASSSRTISSRSSRATDLNSANSRSPSGARKDSRTVSSRGKISLRQGTKSSRVSSDGRSSVTSNASTRRKSSSSSAAGSSGKKQGSLKATAKGSVKKVVGSVEQASSSCQSKGNKRTSGGGCTTSPPGGVVVDRTAGSAGSKSKKISPKGQTKMKTRNTTKKPSRKGSKKKTKSSGKSEEEEDKPNIVFTSLHTRDTEVLHPIVLQLGGYPVAPRVTRDTVTLVAGDITRRTVNMLLACLRGVPVVTDRWVYESLSGGDWAPIDGYMVPSEGWPVIQGVRGCMLRGKAVSLLQHIGCVFIHPHTAPPPADIQVC
ncbi:uncharacterized protein LOC108681994 [Hyalella azteca]|uniref:Uncharacterized protein LOC108681994 n=1 Tax=Hyalella azteca TaxID=294128 RepID=A0A8B7PMD0_HYAAZ|nr:uncharacterized protein LOC108681994 [Hyalella azteca]